MSGVIRIFCRRNSANNNGEIPGNVLKGLCPEGVWPGFVRFKMLTDGVGLVVCKVYWITGSLDVWPTEN